MKFRLNLCFLEFCFLFKFVYSYIYLSLSLSLSLFLSLLIYLFSLFSLFTCLWTVPLLLWFLIFILFLKGVCLNMFEIFKYLSKIKKKNFFFRIRWSLKFLSKNHSLSKWRKRNPKRLQPPNVLRVRCKTEFSDLWKNCFTNMASGWFTLTLNYLR